MHRFSYLALLQVCVYGHAKVYGWVPERESRDARVLHNTALLYTISCFFEYVRSAQRRKTIWGL